MRARVRVRVRFRVGVGVGVRDRVRVRVSTRRTIEEDVVLDHPLLHLLARGHRHRLQGDVAHTVLLLRVRVRARVRVRVRVKGER